MSSSDVTTFGGSVILEDKADVAGDATSFGGNIHLDDGVRVGGDITLFGGRLRREPSASVGGDVTAFTGGLRMPLIFGLPLLMLGAFIALIVWLVRLLTQTLYAGGRRETHTISRPNGLDHQRRVPNVFRTPRLI